VLDLKKHPLVLAHVVESQSPKIERHNLERFPSQKLTRNEMGNLRSMIVLDTKDNYKSVSGLPNKMLMGS